MPQTLHFRTKIFRQEKDIRQFSNSLKFGERGRGNCPIPTVTKPLHTATISKSAFRLSFSLILVSGSFHFSFFSISSSRLLAPSQQWSVHCKKTT